MPAAYSPRNQWGYSRGARAGLQRTLIGNRVADRSRRRRQAPGSEILDLQSLTNAELRGVTLIFATRLRSFQTSTDDTRQAALEKTLPGWSDASRAIGFLRTTQSLQQQHERAQRDFNADFRLDATALETELMARLGIPVRHDGESMPALKYDSADYLEELAGRLSP